MIWIWLPFAVGAGGEWLAAAPMHGRAGAGAAGWFNLKVRRNLTVTVAVTVTQAGARLTMTVRVTVTVTIGWQAQLQVGTETWSPSQVRLPVTRSCSIAVRSGPASASESSRPPAAGPEAVQGPRQHNSGGPSQWPYFNENFKLRLQLASEVVHLNRSSAGPRASQQSGVYLGWNPK